ncbi:hypothetical protein HKX48_009519 [Thoreauomyces humboldtii]|nr:hypothetical protein HKX48_009519 [Thoreauomyces humboldtii]
MSSLSPNSAVKDAKPNTSTGDAAGLLSPDAAVNAALPSTNTELPIKEMDAAQDRAAMKDVVEDGKSRSDGKTGALTSTP